MVNPGSISEDTLRTLVHRFYDRVREDAIIGPIFNNAIGDGWPEHLDTLTSFWSSIMIAAGTYKGNPMAVHLELPRLKQAHLERWLTLWDQTTNELLPPQTASELQQKARFIGQRILETVDAHHHLIAL